VGFNYLSLFIFNLLFGNAYLYDSCGGPPVVGKHKNIAANCISTIRTKIFYTIIFALSTIAEVHSESQKQ
jgi:hypothetical protein